MSDPIAEDAAMQQDGWGEGFEYADHSVNCPCYECVALRADEARDFADDLAEFGEAAEPLFAARHIGDTDETIAGDLESARVLAYFNPGCEVVLLNPLTNSWERFYGPEASDV